MARSKYMLIIFSAMVLQATVAWYPSAALAQQNDTLRGVVLDLSTDRPMQHVEVVNLVTGKAVETDVNGNFSIKVEKNQRLRFEYPGFRTDTLVVIEFELKRVYLAPDESSIRIDEVQISALTDNQLTKEIERARQEGQVAEVSQYRGGIRLSPSRWLSKESRQARQRYDLLIAEQERRKIDARFTPVLISSITPLKGQQLELYMTKYRPTIDFISSANEEELRLYIMDTYAQFKKLTPQELAEIKAPEAE